MNKHQITSYLLLLLAVISLTSASASEEKYDFKSDGVYYKKINNVEVAVCCIAVTNSLDEYYYDSQNYSGDLVIPDSVNYKGNYYKVTKINKWSFYKNTNITSVIIGDNVKTIEENAFYCCNMSSLKIGRSVTRIGKSAFCGCNKLTSLVIPNSVTSIGSDAFSGCKKLTSLVIPNSVTSIGSYAFSGCSGLDNVIIGDGVINIYQRAFGDCKNLKTLTIGKSVESMVGWTGNHYNDNKTRNGSFYGCNKIERIICLLERIISIDDAVFDDEVFYNAQLLVPLGQSSKYKSVYAWKKFLTIEERDFLSKHKLTYLVDGTIFEQYELGYNEEIIIPEKKPKKNGYTFSGWSEIPQRMPPNDVNITGIFTKNTFGQCATPTISFVGGKIHFSCNTEGVTYHYDITRSGDVDVDGELSLALTVTLSVYASKDGYDDSEVNIVNIPLNGGILGDVNNDGVIDVADIATIIYKMAGQAREQVDVGE